MEARQLEPPKSFCYIPLWGIEDGACQCKAGVNCSSAGKHPREYGWRDKVWEDLDAMKAAYPGCNVGIPTGKINGISVVDVDTDKGGLGTFREWQEQNEWLPVTYTVKTGSNGYHYYFEYNPALRQGSDVIGPGVDIRNDDGLVVAPGSENLKGKYAVSYPFPIVQLPDEIVYKIRPREKANEPLVEMDQQVIEGGRNQAIASVAGQLLRKGLEPEIVHKLMIGWNMTNCHPPLPAKEVHTTVNSIAKIDSKRMVLEDKLNRISAVKGILHSTTLQLDTADTIDPVVNDLVGKLQTLLLQPSSDEKPVVLSSAELFDETVEEWKAKDNGLEGKIMSGFPILDGSFGDLRRGGLYIIGAHPGIGKSMLAANMAVNICRQGYSIYIFSFEMSARDYMQRIISQVSGVPLNVHSGFTPEQEFKLNKAREEIASWKLYIEGNDSGYEAKVTQVIHRMKAIPSDVYVFDYIQLLRNDTSTAYSREQDVATCVRDIWDMSGKLNAVAIAPAQRNREGMIRESAEIENAASGIWYLDRTKETPGKAELYVKKNRHGRDLFTVDFNFHGHVGLFEELY